MSRSLLFNILITLGSLFCLLAISSCGDKLETDEDLMPYFDLFSAEAAARGITVDYEAERIEGLIQDISASNVLGQCFRNEEKPKKVIIDKEYWEDSNEMEKQFLIFHELGHCFLNRDHLDASTNGNVCVSIMHSTPQACDFMLTDDNREAYLDELFGI